MGARQWQRAPQAPRERQAGAASDDKDRHGDTTMDYISYGFKAVAASWVCFFV